MKTRQLDAENKDVSSSAPGKQKDDWAEIERRLQPILLSEPVPTSPKNMDSSISSWDWLWNIDDNTIHFSHRVREWLGCEDHQLRNCFHDWLERLHPEDYKETVRRTVEYFNGKSKRYELDFRLRKNDGEYVRFKTCARAVKKGGKTLQLYGQYTLNEEDQAVRTSQQLQEMIQAVPCGVSMLDLSGRYEFVNQAFADALGFQTQELIGRPWGETVHSEDLEAVSVAYERMLLEGRADLKCRVKHHSGETILVEMLLAKRRDADNVDAGHFCFCRPIMDVYAVA